MAEATINQILAIEEEATQLRAEAEREVKNIVALAQQEADILRRKTLTEAREKASRIKERGREAAEERREQLLSQARSEAEEMGAQAEQYFDAAVDFVLDHVAGRA